MTTRLSPFDPVRQFLNACEAKSPGLDRYYAAAHSALREAQIEAVYDGDYYEALDLQGMKHSVEFIYDSFSGKVQ